MKLKIEDKNTVFFSSDLHGFHRNICGGTSKWLKPEAWPIPYNEWKDNEARKKFCKEHHVRDFPDPETMTDLIVDNINSRVKETDTLIVAGDWSFGHISNIRALRMRIKCQNLHLIYGNHDGDIIDRRNGFQDLFSSVQFVKDIEVEKQQIFLSHYSHRVWNKSHRGVWHLFGHSHGNLPDDPNSLSMDVGVDTHPYMMPYSFDEIASIMSKKTFKPVDNHREKKK